MAVYNDKVAQVRIIGTLDGQQISNSLYFQSESTWDALHMNALAGVVASFLSVDLAPLLVTGMVWQQLIVTSMGGLNAPQVIVGEGFPIAGTVNDTAVPNNCALAITLKSGSRGRSARGRIYLAGIPRQQVSASHVQGSFRTNVAAKFNELREAAALVDAEMVVYSTISGKLQRSVGVAFPVTECVITDDVIDSQRRRLPGRGI